MTDLPDDPDADALPPALALALEVNADTPLRIVGVDAKTHERFEAPTTRADLEAAYGERRRKLDDDAQ